MIGISKLLVNTNNFGDSLRYTHNSQGACHGTTHGRGPVVVWNCTKTCNLRCIHCYAGSDNRKYEGELTTEEALTFIDDLQEFKVPVLLISGGGPLCGRIFSIWPNMQLKRVYELPFLPMVL